MFPSETQFQCILFGECGRALYRFYTADISELESLGTREATSEKALFLTRPGAIIPGQFGPISLDFPCLKSRCLTRTISCCGIPSVIHTINGISASIPSRMAAAAPGGGT